MTDNDRTLSDALRLAGDITDALQNVEGLIVFPTYDGLHISISETRVRDPEQRKIQLAKVARILAEQTAQKIDKTYETGAVKLTVALSATYLVEASASSVCKAEVVGTKTVTRKKLVTPAVYEDVVEEVDDVEYDCSVSILRPEIGGQAELTDAAR